jgi:hypothetical protein
MSLDVQGTDYLKMPVGTTEHRPVIVPTPEALEQHGIQAIDIKDVPADKPFKIIDVSDLPDEPQEV